MISPRYIGWKSCLEFTNKKHLFARILIWFFLRSTLGNYKLIIWYQKTLSKDERLNVIIKPICLQADNTIGRDIDRQIISLLYHTIHDQFQRITDTTKAWGITHCRNRTYILLMHQWILWNKNKITDFIPNIDGEGLKQPERWGGGIGNYQNLTYILLMHKLIVWKKKTHGFHSKCRWGRRWWCLYNLHNLA